jgi:3-methyladenine DNA glycosylase AlkC
MAEILKNRYNKQYINKLISEIDKVYPEFETSSFVKSIFDDKWKDKELKDRMWHIANTLGKHLTANHQKNLNILKIVAVNFNDFEAMFFPAFVELYGLDDANEFAISIDALEHFTKHSSSEFSVRPFIKKYPEKMMVQMLIWAKSDNEHIRRLASEGCRPRLPWAMALPKFKKDPSVVIKILEILKNDDSEYVRRSVANNFNDISKDHPKMVLDFADKNLGNHQHLDKLIKHACRTLLKAGDVDALALFGFTTPKHITLNDFKIQQFVKLGDSLQFSFNIKTNEEKLGLLRLEYAIGFKKNNGKLAKKVFKISEANIKENNKSVIKNHSFKLISTRKYYLGTHSLSLIINGQTFEILEFDLINE